MHAEEQGRAVALQAQIQSIFECGCEFSCVHSEVKPEVVIEPAEFPLPAGLRRALKRSSTQVILPSPPEPFRPE